MLLIDFLCTEAAVAAKWICIHQYNLKSALVNESVPLLRTADTLNTLLKKMVIPFLMSDLHARLSPSNSSDYGRVNSHKTSIGLSYFTK